MLPPEFGTVEHVARLSSLRAAEIELRHVDIVTGIGRRKECGDRGHASGIRHFELTFEQILLQFERTQVGVILHVGRQAVGSRQHRIAHGVQLSDDFDFDVLRDRKVHFEHQLGQADRILGLQDRRLQVAQLHLRRKQVVFRRKSVVVLQSGVVHGALHGGLRFAEHFERLLGQQNVIEGLFDFGDQRNPRRARRLHGGSPLDVVHLQRAEHRRGEERPRGVALRRQRIVGSERKPLGHALLDDRAGIGAADRNLGYPATPRLPLHIVEALHLHFGDLDGRVLAQRQIEGLTERETHLCRSAENARRRKAHG